MSLATDERDDARSSAEVGSERPPARVFIVDDHPLVRRGFADLMSLHPDVELCGEAASVGAALEKFESLQPDLAVIDISLQGESGVELVRRLRARLPDLKMLVQSIHEESLFGETVVREGALGYVSKLAPAAGLMRAIRTALRGEVHLSAHTRARMRQRGEEPGSLEADETAT